MMNPLRQPNRTAPSPAHPSSPPVRARVVFATLKPGRVVIDLTTEPGGLASTLDAFVPLTLWGLAAAVKLEQWAKRSAKVDLHLVNSKGNSRAKLSDGRSQMLLDLRRVPDLGAAGQGSQHRLIA